MTETTAGSGASLRLARQARGFSQQQLAGMAGVSRQAVSAVEAGHSDPSLRVALAIAQSLGMSVEELFGPGEPAAPVTAVSVAPLAWAGQEAGKDAGKEKAEPETTEFTERMVLAPVGDRFVALPLRGDAGAGLGFLPAGGIARPLTEGRAASPPEHANGSSGRAAATARHPGNVLVRPIGPPRPTLVVAGCDPALPLLATPLALLDPPVAFAWWPCGSAEALRLAGEGLVHAAGVHADAAGHGKSRRELPPGSEVIGFTAWREGLTLRTELAGAVGGLDDIARNRLRVVNREPGAEARRLLDAERQRLSLAAEDLAGYDSAAAGHLQVASAVAAGLADAGVASEPAARAYGLAFIPLAAERFNLVIPAEHAAAREVQALLKVLTSPWLLAQLAGIPGYDAANCGDRIA